jgi:hypothetical protein
VLVLEHTPIHEHLLTDKTDPFGASLKDYRDLISESGGEVLGLLPNHHFGYYIIAKRAGSPEPRFAESWVECISRFTAKEEMYLNGHGCEAQFHATLNWEGYLERMGFDVDASALQRDVCICAPWSCSPSEISEYLVPLYAMIMLGGWSVRDWNALMEQRESQISDSRSVENDVTALGSSKRKPLKACRSHGEIGLGIPPESEEDVLEFVRYMLARRLIG